MNTKKRIACGLAIVLSLAYVGFVCWENNNLFSKKPSLNLAEQLEAENVEDLCLTIYHVHPLSLWLVPLTTETIVEVCGDQKIVVQGAGLEEQLALFKQISEDDLIPVRKKSFQMIDLYYTLESTKNGTLLDVAMWGCNGNSIYVNGFEVQEKAIFFNVIQPFMPEEAVNDFKEAGSWQE